MEPNWQVPLQIYDYLKTLHTPQIIKKLSLSHLLNVESFITF
jgi:hypothetical protein